jgi:hypothetical protein
MAEDRAYVATNRAELERLRRLVDRLSDQELTKPMPAGWTAASVLAHLAFWDYRVVTLLDRWGPDGRGAAPSALTSEAEADWINDAGKPMCLALSPRVAARMAVEAAEAADQRVSALSDALLAANRAAGMPISLLRATHRREHLDEIEHALGAAKA